ncbi:MAG: UDP-N-acetylmuramoyl-L-alanine--D-glutamate ligase [Ignavibacteriales bacterium]|nr:UDP-N-acetylmuramoyl-L-alanine--D-glutamate ligase [Ignavibacteriales bacterium]
MMEVRGTRVSVIGAARSGVAVAKLMQSKGAAVFVSDGAADEKITAQVAELKSAGIACEIGGHSARVYESTLMILSPGVPSDAPVVFEAQRRGVKVVSELEAASWFCPCPIVGITGTNGKTTTTALTGRVLGDAKKNPVVAGNIGTAFSGVVEAMTKNHIAVLEVSSFQLDHCTTFHPKVSAILNITPDHLDRYGNSMERYAASKARIFQNQSADDTLVYCADDEWTALTVRSVRTPSERLPADGQAGGRARKLAFSVKSKQSEGAFVEQGILKAQLGGSLYEILDVEQISIKGTHNLYNAMAATLIGLRMGVSPASIRATLKNFKAVEHRLEFVRELDGVRYYNDSKATNVDAVWYALQAFKEPIVLLLGGRDKGNDYARLNELVRNRVRSIVAIGESAATVENAFKKLVPVIIAASIDEAVATAKSLARSGDVVLLSPACASFDWFKNYEQRGQVFKQLVVNL